MIYLNAITFSYFLLMRKISFGHSGKGRNPGFIAKVDSHFRGNDNIAFCHSCESRDPFYFLAQRFIYDS